MKNTVAHRITTFFRYILITVLVISLIGLVMWYFFLRSKTTTISDAARGSGTSAPVFEGTGGSTYQNVLSDIGSSVASSSQSLTQHQRPPQLWRVSPNPTAGMGFVTSGATTAIYFVERATGYVFFANVETGELVRVTNTLRPKIYEAFFTKNGSVIERSLDDAGNVITFAGTLPTAPTKNSTTTSGALVGTLLERNIISIAVNPVAPEIFYTTVDAKVGLVGIRVGWNGSKAKQIFTSNMLDWRVRWLQDGRLILTQNAADNTVGYSYELSPSGVQSPLIGDIAGLTLLPRTSSPALIYGMSRGGLSLFAKTDPKTSAVRLPLKTVADKCVWAPSKAARESTNLPLFAYCAVPQVLPPGNFLDQWYQGVVHTEDVWWKVDAKAGEATIMFSKAMTRLDVDRPTIDESGNYIAFINATDKTLWLLRLDLGGSGTSTGSQI